MKLFHMCEEETWIGPDLESTKAACLKVWGDTIDARETLDDAREYTVEELNTVTVDCSENPGQDPGPILAAAQFLDYEIRVGGEFPRYAFGTEW